MDLLSIVVLIIVIFICVYALVDRVCKCVEHRSISNVVTKQAAQNKDITEWITSMLTKGDK